MKLIKNLLICVAILSIGMAQAQDNELLNIVENDNGKLRPVTKQGPQIVDINGNLEISISKEKTRAYIAANYPELGSQLAIQDKIDKLQKALKDKQELLNLLDKNIRNATDDAALNKAMLTFLNLALQPGYEDLAAQYNSLYYQWDAKYGSGVNPPVKMESYILSQLDASLAEAQTALKSVSNTSYSLSLVAYLKNKNGENKDKDSDRVHIQNFDNYAEQQFYTVERWVTTLSSSQQTQLAQMQETTAQMNATSFNIFSSIKTKLQSYLSDLKCVLTLKTKVQQFLNDDTIIPSLTVALKADANNLLAEFNTYTDILDALEGNVSNWSIDTVFEVVTQLEQAAALTQNLPALIDKFTNTAAAIAAISAQVNSLVADVDACYKTVKTKAELVANALGLLKNQQNNYLSNSQIGKEVLSFTIDNLPTKGYITLKGAGQRANGDQLEIDFILRLPKAATNATTGTATVTDTVNHVLDRRMLTMQLIGLRSETTVGIILADPFNDDGLVNDADTQRFLYAPSASLLLKFGSRTSNFYNEFIDFGFGINVATPDFNTDGTPEFGFGAVFTAFKDILSVGMNYNVTLDVPYWSFGINLPFNLPGIPINGPK